MAKQKGENDRGGYSRINGEGPPPESVKVISKGNEKGQKPEEPIDFQGFVGDPDEDPAATPGE